MSNVGREAVTPQQRVEILLDRIALLVQTRQQLRAQGEPGEQLERNRLQIAQAQQELSAALLACHLPAQSQAA
jgi:hypothetical protein